MWLVRRACDKLVTFNVRELNPKESQLSLKTCQNSEEENEPSTKELHPLTQSVPNAQERQFNISVREVESINLSSIQSKPLMLSDAETNISAEISGHGDLSIDMDVFFEARRFDPLTNNGIGKSSYNSENAVVINRDPRLRPRENCNSSTEHQTISQNPVGYLKSQPNIDVCTGLAANRDPRLQPRHNGDSPLSLTSHNHIIAKVASLPDFDPSIKNQSITLWISRVNEIAMTCKLTDQQVVKFAMSKLVGNAKRWYEGFSCNLSWGEWQNKLKSAFPVEENYGKMLSEMLSKTAKTGDSLEEYCCKKMTMLNRCSIRGKRAVECIIYGIKDEPIRTKAEAEKFNDPDKLQEYLRNVTESSCAVTMELLYNDLVENS